MNRKFLILLAFPLFLFACANDAQKGGETASQEVVANEEHSEDHDHANHEEAITLDNGKAWKVDGNMMAFIKKMDKEVATFSGKDYNAYQLLAMNLTENIEGLTSNCTMTGQAHDELHKWLLPYIDLVNDFAKAENMKDAQVALNKIKTSFKTFNQFFI